ncbi:hypothetical protein, unknown function [Leishmania donovani]|uniref:Uncharacterized protein n=1 Tax=Leishmania donovani TaxID=5661 RepID=E9B8U4_LEIDO|nr:hypothetical protein, unknown function [Leishmania donovani]CBZ31667.1 hypothetical protein, unknown function [Leishmania donovani]
MQRRGWRPGHDPPGSSPVTWLSNTSCTFSYASSAAARGALICGAAAASIVETQQLADAAARARCRAHCRCGSAATALRRSSLQLPTRRLQSSTLASAPFIVTRKCPLHTASSPPPCAEPAPQGHSGGDGRFSVPTPSAAAAATDSTRQEVVHRRRQAKRAAARSESASTSAEKRASEEAGRYGRDARDTSSGHPRHTKQPLSAAAASQRTPMPARQDECIPGQGPALLEAARLPAPPTRYNATPESICSYLLTLRRAVSCNRAGTHLSSMTRRAALVFMHQILPTLMAMPPVPEADLLTGSTVSTPGGDAAVERHDVESGASSSIADAARASCDVEPLAHPSFPPQPPPRASHPNTLESLPASADASRQLKEWGKGTVPWTEPLAEAILLMCNRLDCEIRQMWVARAALLYLVFEEGKACADPLQPQPAALGAPASSPTRTPRSTLNDKAQLALALMRTLEVHRRQSRLMREVLRPVTMRFALQLREKANAAASSDGLGSRGEAAAVALSELRSRDRRAAGVGGDGKVAAHASFVPRAVAAPLPPRESSFVNLERYLADGLLPLLYGEFVHYCRAVEQWHDCSYRAVAHTTVEATTAAASTAAAAPAASPQQQHAPRPSAQDGGTCLPYMSRADIETFSLLAAVLHRALGLRGVARCGDEVYFDLNGHGADAYTSVAPRSHGIASDPSGGVGASADHLQYGREQLRGSMTDAAPAGAPRPPRKPRCQPAVPLRALRLTIEAITARLDADGGPHTGAQELVSRNSMQQVRAGYDVRTYSPPPFVPPLDARGARGGGDPSPPSSASSPTSRFGGAAASSSARSPRVPSATAPSPKAAREGRCHGGCKGHDCMTTGSGSPRTTTTTPSPLDGFGNFNIGSFLPILTLCAHDRSFNIFVTTAADRTGVHAATTSVAGSASPASPTPAAEPSAPPEEDVSALAAAVSRLLLLGVYWAPLCRTYQLPAVLAFFARATTVELTHAAAEKSTSAAAAAAGPSPHPASSHSTAASQSTGPAREAAPAPLDTKVLQLVRDAFLPPSDDLAAPSSPFVQQLSRLIYSSGRYIEWLNFGTFANIAATLDRVLSQWPMHHADVATAAPARFLSGNADVGCGCASDDRGGGGGGACVATAATASSGGELSSSAATSSFQRHDVVARDAGTTPAADAAGTAVAPHATGSCVVFRAPVAAGMATLHVFAAIADEFWSREHGRIMWQAISRQARQRLAVMSSTALMRAYSTRFLGFSTHTCTYTRLRVAVPNVTGDGTTTTTAAANGVREILTVPFYVLRLMGVRSAAAESMGTPDEVLRVYRTSERAESYMAVLNALGSTTAARPLICEYLRSDFMWRTIPNDAFVPLVTALVELELTSMTVPELLWVSGSLEHSTGPKHGQTATWSLPGRLAGCFSSHTMKSLNARVEPHELRLLTTDDEDAYTFCMETDARELQEMTGTDNRHGGGKLPLLHFTLRRISRDGRVLDPPPSATTTPSAVRGHTGGRGSATRSSTVRHAPRQGAGGGRTPTRFVGAPTCYSLESVAKLLWEPAYSKSPNEGARMPLTAFPPLLRSMTLLSEAERRVDDAMLHDAADLRRDGASPGSSEWHAGSEPLSLCNVELILRMAWRLLFGSASEAAAVAAPTEAVPLEALVTLYLSLTSVASQWTASSHTRALGARAASREPAETSPVAGERARRIGGAAKALAPPSILLAVDCCLAHCEAALRPRLMAIALHTDGSGAGDAACMKPERVATDLRVSLQLAVLTERLLPCPANMAAPATAGMPVHELIHRQLFCELRASLREAPLQRIAGEVSRLPWWVARRAHAEVSGDGTSPSTSWVEPLLLREIGAKRLPVTERATTAAAAPSAASCSSTSHHSFELFEWALLPFYAKLEARQHDANAAATTADKAATAPSQPHSTAAPMMDSFLCLEDAYHDSAAGLAAHRWSPQSSLHGLSTGLSSGATTDATSVNGDGSTTAFQTSGRSSAPHMATLEAALNALPAQCDSFHILLHVVRQLFLSHPVLLSTAPDAALYYELRAARTAPDHEKSIASAASSASAPEHVLGAAVGRQAWATLPTQRVDLPHDLRQRYVDALFRCFKRLVPHHSCTAEELVELLHLLWLADPNASRVASSAPSSSTKASTSQWPSLFARCSAFVKGSLAELDAAVEMQDTNPSLKDGKDVGASPWLLRSVPDVLQTVYRTVHYGLTKSIVFKPREMHWLSVNAMALHPRSMVLFLHCLNIVRGLEEQRQQHASTPQPLSKPPLPQRQQRAHHSLNRLHKSTLELFQPFVVYASITGEATSGVAKMRYMPLMLGPLSDMDPQLVLVLIQATFAGAMWSSDAGKDPHGRGGGSSRRERANAGNAVFYRKMLAASQTGVGPMRMGQNGHLQPTRTLGDGGVQNARRLPESIAATMAALLMVASHVQASSTVWASNGGVGGHGDAYSAMGTRAAPRRAPSAHIGRAHHSALIFLRNSLYELLLLARSRRPLQCASAVTVVQVMQLAVVQESPRMARLLDWLFLSLLIPPVQIVEKAIVPAATNASFHRGSGFAAAPLELLSSPATANTATAATLTQGGSGNACESSDKYSLVIPVDTLGGTRFPAAHEAVLLLRLLPVQYWRSLLHRDVCWPRYRGYALQMLNRRWRSLGVTRSDTHTADTMRHPTLNKWNQLRGSLSSLLLSLDVESIACLVAEAMGPMVLLVVTTELLRVLARQRACSGDSPTTARKEAEGMPRAVCAAMRTAPHTGGCQHAQADEWPAGIAAPSDAGDDTLSPAALTSFEVVRLYASPRSVLADEAVQPWLEAACNVIDQLASTRHTDFVAVLEREAEWQRRVTEASSYRGAAAEEMPLGVFHRTAVEAMAAARAATKGGACETAAPVLDIGEDGVTEASGVGDGAEARDKAALDSDTGAPTAGDDVSALVGSDGCGAPTTDLFATTAAALDDAAGEWSEDSDAAAERPLVLDWRPIAEFVRAVREVDPGISQRQVRLECWMRQPELAAGAPAEAQALPAARTRPFSPATTPTAPSASFAEAAVAGDMDDARDVLHNAAGAILQHARAYWQAADRAHGVRPLLMMNLRDALNFYSLDTQQVCHTGDGAAGGQLVSPTYEGDTAKAPSSTASSAARDSTRDSAEIVEQARWLEYVTGGSDFDRSNDPAASWNSLSTTMVLGLVRPCPALSVPSIRAPRATGEATTVGEHKRRRIALLRRAGVLASAQEMAERCRAYGLSCAMRRDGARTWLVTYATDFWRRKSRRLQREIFECVVGDDDVAAAARARLHASASGVSANRHAGAARQETAAAASVAGRPVMDGRMSDVERRARHRLQLLRCDDLAQLLLLMTSKTSAALPLPSAKGGANTGTEASLSLLQLKMRVVMETMAELLPSASTNELMQVVLALLKLSISAAATDASSTDATASQLLHYVCLEARRLLANVAVLVANDVERFTFGELLWLITRLHTPCIRAAAPPRAQSAQQAEGGAAARGETFPRPTHGKTSGDESLDVSMSYVSAAVARAIRVVIEGSNDPTGGERGDCADPHDEIGDDTDVSTNRTAAFDDEVPVNSQSASPVTVAQWAKAVAAAEQLQGKSQMQYLLQLVERSAV